MLDTAPLPRERALVVLARYPRAGEVKSRLAASIGAEAAAGLYRAFLIDIGRRFATDPRWTFHWSFAPVDSPFEQEIAAGSAAFAQDGGDLGARMAGAIARLMADGFSQVVLVGSDVPHLPPGRVAEAFTWLGAGAPLVLGPAEDGGYYLIGVRGSVPPVFAGISWGSAQVLRETLGAANAAGIPARVLSPTYDVDTIADLERLRREIASGAADGLEATRQALERVAGVRYKQIG